MALQFIEHPPYDWRGFQIRIYVAEIRTGKFRAFWNVNTGLGGDCGPSGYTTAEQAHVSAMAYAKEKIEYVLSKMPLEQLRNLGLL